MPNSVNPDETPENTASESDRHHDDNFAKHASLTLPEQNMPDKIYLMPTTNRPFFPAQIQPLEFRHARWDETLKRVHQTPEKILGLSYIQDFHDHPIESSKFPIIGCAVKVHNIVEVNDQIQFIALGLKRFKIINWLRKAPPYLVQVEYPENPIEKADEIQAYTMALINAIKELLPLNPLYTEELKNYLNRFNPKDPSPLADFAAAITTAAAQDLQDVLDTIPLMRRMEKVLTLIKREKEVALLQHKITEEVNNQISKQQREFFLKEQLKIIQKELGLSKDDKTSELDKFKTRLKNKTLTEENTKKINQELEKFSLLELGSPEFSICRNYLDWITLLPWSQCSKDNLNLISARKILDQDHDGLHDVKDRIIEFLALGVYKKEISGSILLLSGPPGVGKTSIGKSVANALGRKFYRFSVGGMQDESEIKGHRRTYIGAMPGKLIQALKEVEISNPVIMLDEIDKMGQSYRGDPASALLEVLDPAQNVEFLDHYLDMRVDLSKVFFICTANQHDLIPSPLLDRMDIIRLSGYITQEKILIAKNHLWPDQLKKAGLTNKQIVISDAGLKQIIEGYARESGVRHLEKLLARIIRKSVVKILKKPTLKIIINIKNLIDYIGEPYFKNEKAINAVGVITGLAWTSMGGDTLPIEASCVHKKSAGLKLTGKLGDVMKESAEIAYSYIMSTTKKYDIPQHFFEDAFIHLHVPEGATPKDGPSAGVTMASTLLSLAKKRKPRHLAMTGELTLTGKVLPVGGIREKVIAAKRNGVKELILPKANQRDYNELPIYIKQDMKIHFADHFKDVASKLFK
ncbi:MAG: endopeptidase La [Endozoicomonadaceae bacterium]|nr:endopeptidase La [Endozoicomonadaceae bacterium]